VREVIEASPPGSLDDGLSMGRYNLRGVTTRGVYEGGEQEHVLARRYREYAVRLQARWPRTAAMLRDLASTYESEALQHDIEAERRADRG
jgi:hypothetical protein